METLEAIKTRRSVRTFSDRKVAKEKVVEILDAARFAPSGLNNQPWKFSLINDTRTRGLVAKETQYGSIIMSAPISVAVFLDTRESYDRTKDVQAVGACMQNILLAAHALNLGGCWLGEIVKNKEKVNAILKVPEECELMAVIALGYGQSTEKADRKELEELMI